MMGYNFAAASGNWGAGMMFFGSIVWLLTIVVLVLAIVALWKYINKKK